MYLDGRLQRDRELLACPFCLLLLSFRISDLNRRQSVPAERALIQNSVVRCVSPSYGERFPT